MSKYEQLIDILRTRAVPSDYEEIRQSLLDEFREEVGRRFENILNTERFDRRLDRRNNGFRKKIIEKQGNTCSDCGKKLRNNEIEVSHILPVVLFPELTFEEWNCRVKCHICNLKDGRIPFRWLRKQKDNVREMLKKADYYFTTRVR